MSPDRFEDTARQLHELAKRYHRFSKHPSGFLEAITSRSVDDLQDYKEWSRQFVTKVDNGVKQISPVVFLRRILVDRILAGQDVELADIEVIQNHIENRNLNFFSDYPDLHDAIANQKERKRSAFTAWNPFRVLFYIDYHFKSAEVNHKLEWIATALQEELSLSDSDYHLAGFAHNQNYGTDYCWTSLYPSEAGDHKISYAIAFSARPDEFRYGLAAGDRVENGKYVEESVAPDEFDPESVLDFYETLTPQYYELNQALLQAPRKESSAQAESATQHPLNLILYGPPGTGKTYSVQRRALSIIEGNTKGIGDDAISRRFRDYMEEGRIEFTTFHPSYSYEEFVEGFRYDPNAKIPVLHSGIFKQIVQRAVDTYPSTPCVLIIDEINRGNLSRIFGELITLLESDKRKGASNELSARLPYSQERFTIPPNLYVIGTMNTADRSIALLDVALRRRFEFEEMMPDVQVIREQLTATLDEEDTDAELSAEQVELISDVFEAVNRRISILLDRDHQIGHSYFLDVESMTDLHRVLYGRVFPLLQEYFYNDFNRLVDLLGKHIANQKTGFVKIKANGHETTFATGRSHQPLWTFHRYKSGELEDALRSTFLPD